MENSISLSLLYMTIFFSNMKPNEVECIKTKYAVCFTDDVRELMAQLQANTGNKSKHNNFTLIMFILRAYKDTSSYKIT